MDPSTSEFLFLRFSFLGRRFLKVPQGTEERFDHPRESARGTAISARCTRARRERSSKSRIRRIRDEYETSTSAYSCSGKERLAPLSPRSFQDAEARQKLPGLAVRVNHILSLGLALLPFFFGFQQGTVSRPAKRTARNPLNGHAREKEESNKSVISYPAFS